MMPNVGAQISSYNPRNELNAHRLPPTVLKRTCFLQVNTVLVRVNIIQVGAVRQVTKRRRRMVFAVAVER